MSDGIDNSNIHGHCITAQSNGAKFHEIVKMTDIYEGSIVRV